MISQALMNAIALRTHFAMPKAVRSATIASFSRL
jgi:hypothetical protein